MRDHFNIAAAVLAALALTPAAAYAMEIGRAHV